MLNQISMQWHREKYTAIIHTPMPMKSISQWIKIIIKKSDKFVWNMELPQTRSAKAGEMEVANLTG